MKRLLLILFTYAFLAPTALAEDDVHQQAAEAIKARLLAVRPDIPIIDIQPTAMPGIYQVDLPAGQTLHFSADGEFFLSGDLYRLEDRLVNLTEEGRAVGRKKLLDELDESQMLVYSPPEGRVKGTLTVFTDVDCIFCRKFHDEIPELNRLGIAVRYLAFPRAGTNSPSYEKLVSAWCSENPQIALTMTKSFWQKQHDARNQKRKIEGQDIPPATCVNPVASHYELAGKLGINSTPMVILDDGTLMPGYKTAANFAQILGVL